MKRSPNVNAPGRHAVMTRKQEDDMRRLCQSMLKAHDCPQKAFAAERIQALADAQRAQEVDAAACHAVMMRKQEDLMLRLHRAEEALQHSTRDYILCRLCRSLLLHKKGPACQLASHSGVYALSVLLVLHREASKRLDFCRCPTGLVSILEAILRVVRSCRWRNKAITLAFSQRR